MEFVGRAVVEHCHPACEREPAGGAVTVRQIVIVSTVECRVSTDGFDLHCIQRDLFGGCRRGCREHDDSLDGIGCYDCPFEYVHCPHRATDNSGKPINPECPCERNLCPHLVTNREERKP